MDILKQLAIIFGVCLLGKAICLILPISFPASVMCMSVMLFFLSFKLIKLTQIQRTAEFLLSNMAFFFIPAGVVIIENYSQVEGKVLGLLAVCALTTLITFLATAYTIMFIVKIQNKRKKA